MPIITSKYKPPFLLRNGHLATIVPSTWRKVDGVTYNRERINTPDGDFLDLDWLTRPNQNDLIVISHGLEGSSNRPYVKGMAKYFFLNNRDVLAWNCRGCSGEINRKGRFYHHGETGDLDLVITHALASGKYKNVALVGFSMGGSMTLKYLGEKTHVDSHINAAAVFSVPVNLKSSVEEFQKSKMAFYRKRFLKKLEKKISLKAQLYPNEIKYHDFSEIKYFPDFDRIYTAPLHGFADEHDFYKKASAEQYLPGITIPTLLVNALNDPFLPGLCYPFDLADKHKYVHFEAPEFGGHVGFSIANHEFNYMEKRTFEFVQACEKR